MFTGLRSIIYPSADITADKAFWSAVSGTKPYFDQLFYVGFEISGCELGLDPNASKEGLDYPITYWKVDDIAEAAKTATENSAVEVAPINDVGGGILMARFKDKSNNIFGLIEMPVKFKFFDRYPKIVDLLYNQKHMEQFGASQKIVIVEDNVDLADIYKTRLELLGYKCFTAFDGVAALDIIQKEMPNLVLLDLMVPKIAGDQILERMRASDWGKTIPVYIISNLNEADAPAGLRNYGIEGYAVKANLSNDQIDQLVDNILKPADQKDDVLLEIPRENQ